LKTLDAGCPFFFILSLTMPKKSGKKNKARPQATSKSKPSQVSSATRRSSAVADMLGPTKKGGEKRKAQQTTSNPTSKPTPCSQASSEGSRQSKRKRDQGKEQVKGNETKNKTPRVTSTAAEKTAKRVEGGSPQQTSDAEELPLSDLDEAVQALMNMYARVKAGKRQLGKRRSGDTLHLSPSLFVAFAHRYRAARNANKDVDYQRLSETANFKAFKDHAEELKAKEHELKALLKKALAEQRDIDAGKHKKSIEDLEEEVTRLDEQHAQDVAKCKQLEVDIEQREEQHSLEISKLKESYKVGIEKLQSELIEVKAKYNALNEVMKGRSESVEVGGDMREVKNKVAELEAKLSGETARQMELVAFDKRLAERDAALSEKGRWLAAETKNVRVEWERIKDERATLEREKSRHDSQVRADQRVCEDWRRALDEATDEAKTMRDAWAAEREYAKGLKAKLDSYGPCCV